MGFSIDMIKAFCLLSIACAMLYLYMSIHFITGTQIIQGILSMIVSGWYLLGAFLIYKEDEKHGNM